MLNLILFFFLIFSSFLNTANAEPSSKSCQDYLNICEKSCADRGDMVKFSCFGNGINPGSDRYRCLCGDNAFQASTRREAIQPESLVFVKRDNLGSSRTAQPALAPETK